MTDEEFTSDVRRYRDMLFRLAYSCTGDLSCCDDIVQEAFIKYYRRKRGFDGNEGKKAWLIRVTVNLCRNHTAFWWNKRRTELQGEISSDISAGNDEIIALKQALAKLKPIYREVVYLHYFEGYTCEQTAKMLGLTVSGVTARLRRARQFLKNYMEEI